MVTGADVEKVVATTSKKRKRPDALDGDRYKNISRWSYKRWAWEFLRRNENFIKECKRVEFSSNEEKQDVAKAFGLKKFKSCKEGYLSKSGYPKFSLGSISSWSYLQLSSEEPQIFEVEIKYGQVLIRYDLASALADKKVLDKQLQSAESRVRRRMEIFENKIQKKAAEHRPKAYNFGKYIRLLDYLAHGKTPLECARLILPSKIDENTDHYMRQHIKSPIEAAKQLANEGYLYLSILHGKPDSKEMRIET